MSMGTTAASSGPSHGSASIGGRYWRWLSVAVGIGSSVAILWPLSWDRRRDSFPLSPYPMFTWNRTHATVHAAVGSPHDAYRKAHRLEPRFIANDEVMLAAATVRRAIRRRGDAPRVLCEEIARRVAVSGSLEHLRWIALVSDTFNPLDYIERGSQASRRRVSARCRIPR
ncbi:MAG: hypothetical protein V3V08_20855 [Nannocystaceae bacterium]